MVAAGISFCSASRALAFGPFLGVRRVVGQQQYVDHDNDQRHVQAKGRPNEQ